MLPHPSPPSSTTSRRRKKKKILIIISITSLIFISIFLIILILALTVFKPKNPIITVNSVALHDFEFSIDVPQLQIHLNLSLLTNITVTNPNRVGFKNANSTAFLKYRGNTVGEAPIPSGKINAHETTNMDITLTLMADRLASDSGFISDVLSGKLGFQSFIKLPGKVHVVFDIHVVAYVNCDLEIDAITRSLVSQTCSYKTKL